MRKTNQAITVHRHLVGAVLALLGLIGCKAAPSTVSDKRASTESELAARRLQPPLNQHLCSAAVYPNADQSWRMVRVVGLSGRGPDFISALEALCRETDGKKLPAVVDIYFTRAPSGWSNQFEIRGTAVRFEDSSQVPPAPDFNSIRQPEPPQNSDDEPAPQGESGKKS